MSDRSGELVGRYRLDKRLGQGGMALVYKAYDTRLDRSVAIKFIRADAFPPAIWPEVFDRFEREAKALARLADPHIVKVFDFGEYDGSPYLVMEYIGGGTLRQRLGKPVDTRIAVQYLLPIARALAYAHKAGLVHRDVKPGNILFREDGTSLLADFGIAKILENHGGGHTLTATGESIGTPEYMAPEQCLGRTVDGRADIYSLGVVFYELIAGRPPFKADTPMGVIVKHVSETPPAITSGVPELAAAMGAILQRALAKQPEDRYQTMDEFVQALRRLDRSTGLDPINRTDDETSVTVVKAPREILDPAPVQDSGQAAPHNDEGRKRHRQRSPMVPYYPLLGGAVLLVAGLIGLEALRISNHAPDNTPISAAPGIEAIVYTATPPPPTATALGRVATSESGADGVAAAISSATSTRVTWRPTPVRRTSVATVPTKTQAIRITPTKSVARQTARSTSTRAAPTASRTITPRPLATSTRTAPALAVSSPTAQPTVTTAPTMTSTPTATTASTPTAAPTATAFPTSTPTVQPPTPVPPTATGTAPPVSTALAPVFVYPLNGQQLDYIGDYMFMVEPAAGVDAYLWGFFQNDIMVWENYRDEGTLSANHYAIPAGTSGHSKFVPGPVQVWVRAVKGNSMSDATIITITLR